MPPVGRAAVSTRPSTPGRRAARSWCCRPPGCCGRRPAAPGTTPASGSPPSRWRGRGRSRWPSRCPGRRRPWRRRWSRSAAGPRPAMPTSASWPAISSATSTLVGASATASTVLKPSGCPHASRAARAASRSGRGVGVLRAAGRAPRGHSSERRTALTGPPSASCTARAVDRGGDRGPAVGVVHRGDVGRQGQQPEGAGGHVVHPVAHRVRPRPRPAAPSSPAARRCRWRRRRPSRPAAPGPAPRRSARCGRPPGRAGRCGRRRWPGPTAGCARAGSRSPGRRSVISVRPGGDRVAAVLGAGVGLHRHRAAATAAP